VKVIVLRNLFIAACVMSLTACGGSSSGDGVDPETIDADLPDTVVQPELNPDTEVDADPVDAPSTTTASDPRSWTINQFSYIGAPVASIQASLSDFVVTNSSSTGFDTANGAFSGSVIVVTALPAGSQEPRQLLLRCKLVLFSPVH